LRFDTAKLDDKLTRWRTAREQSWVEQRIPERHRHYLRREDARFKSMTTLDLSRFQVLNFDCYGTLIDWESGLLAALRPILASHAAQLSDGELLETYGRHESEVESGPYRRYREVLAEVLRRIGAQLGFEPAPAELESFAGSVGDWPAFPDSTAALRTLKDRFGLAVLTNCDDDLFAQSQRRLGVDFDWVITAEQARSYKPSHRNFELAFTAIGAPRERILHVAQSLFHDHVPAKELGMATVWIDRRSGLPGSGATAPAEASPDLVLPDLRSLAELAVSGAEPRS
jgi:2-haloacid dehalogenase